MIHRIMDLDDEDSEDFDEEEAIAKDEEEVDDGVDDYDGGGKASRKRQYKKVSASNFFNEEVEVDTGDEEEEEEGKTQGKISEARKEIVASVMQDLTVASQGSSEPEARWFELFSSRYRKVVESLLMLQQVLWLVHQMFLFAGSAFMTKLLMKIWNAVQNATLIWAVFHLRNEDSLSDGSTLISKDETFELGFFNPGNSPMEAPGFPKMTMLAMDSLLVVMVLEYKLTYPSGTATAMLINSFHTKSGAKLAGNQVRQLGKYLSISFFWSCFKWFFRKS